MDTQSRPETPHIEQTVRISSSDELAEFLRAASESGTPVIPVGGGTSLHTGNVTESRYTALNLGGLSGVREYHPTDLTASFWAGTTLADVQATLGEHGQELPVDMVHPETATIGGMVATGFAGPRRLGSGTLKDLIIGCEYIRGDGLLAKAGGMLVKNVSGYEVPRFLHGSWGSLAVISAINLKVIPKPKADVTLVHMEDSLQESLATQRALLREHPGVMAVVTEKREDGWAMAVRLMGRRASLDAQLASFKNDLGSHTEVTEGGEWWKRYGERWAAVDGTARLVVSGRSAALQEFAHEVPSIPGLTGMALSLGTGTLRMQLSPDRVDRDEIEGRLRQRPLSWVIESAPATWRGTDSVWGPRREDEALARSIKAEFDPAGILNRGRLFI